MDEELPRVRPAIWCCSSAKDATEAGMLKAIEDVARSAITGSTIIFYYAGHGYTGARTGMFSRR